MLASVRFNKTPCTRHQGQKDEIKLQLALSSAPHSRGEFARSVALGSIHRQTLSLSLSLSLSLPLRRAAKDLSLVMRMISLMSISSVASDSFQCVLALRALATLMHWVTHLCGACQHLRQCASLIFAWFAVGHSIASRLIPLMEFRCISSQTPSRGVRRQGGEDESVWKQETTVSRPIIESERAAPEGV